MSDFIQTTQVTEAKQALDRLRESMRASIKGKDDVIEQVIICLLGGGHLLIEDLPGVGKTTLAYALARSMDCTFSRVQFTSDLLPGDVTGVAIYDETIKEFVFKKGPVFANVVLADEINRATPKTQSALLEAMQERTVTAAGKSMELPKPFFVLATQNPIEMEGTYRLPEAQIDRFLFKSEVQYPGEDDLHGILDLTTGADIPVPKQVLSADDILTLQKLVRQVPVASHVTRAIARFAISTQPKPGVQNDITKYFRFGISPRGAQSLMLASKGHALLSGRYNVGFEDLRAILAPTLRHRCTLNYEGEAEGINPDQVLNRLLDEQTRKAA